MNDPHAEILADVFGLLLPEIVLGVTACVLFLGGTFRVGRNLWSCVALVGLAGAFVAIPGSQETNAVATFASLMVFDSLSMLIRGIALIGGVLLVLFSWNEVPEGQTADHLACLLVIIAGVGLSACANDLVSLFLALELVSIPTYILLYLPRHDDASQEAALKYFLLSVFSSALLLFGFSYLYGLAGTTNIAAILHTLNDQADPGALPVVARVALIMVVAGLGFRITAAPFHFYAPDVYQGAPLVGAALLAFIPKVAGFVALIRVFGFVLPGTVEPRGGLVGMGLSDQVPILFWFLAAVTMFLGNLLALLQDNLKRLLAYSSVAHAGYMLVALASAPFLHSQGNGSGPDGVEALLYYLVAYGAMTIGAFAVLSYLDNPSRPVETVDDLAGLSGSHPGIALLMALFLFSLIGIPLTAGFTGKFFVFFGAMTVPGDHANLFRVLALLGMVNAAIGGWYYLRLVAVMYLRNPLRPIDNATNRPALITLVLCALITVGLSVPPGVNWLQKAAQQAAGAKVHTVDHNPRAEK